MNLQTIAMRVAAMALEPQTDYMSEPPYRKFDQTRVTLAQQPTVCSPYADVTVYVLIPEGAPNPFVMGQLLTLSIGPDAKPTPVPVPDPQPEPGPDGHPFIGVDADRDEALGLGGLRDNDESGYVGTRLQLVGAGV